MSNASGRDEVYVWLFPAREPAVRVSRDGGMYPDWRRDGKELFFLAPDGSMMAAGFDAKTGSVQAAPQKLFDTPLRFGNGHPYAVSADGQRFLIPWDLDDLPRVVLDGVLYLAMSGMSPESRERISGHYHAALACPAEERRAFLDLC